MKVVKCRSYGWLLLLLGLVTGLVYFIFPQAREVLRYAWNTSAAFCLIVVVMAGGIWAAIAAIRKAKALGPLEEESGDAGDSRFLPLAGMVIGVAIMGLAVVAWVTNDYDPGSLIGIPVGLFLLFAIWLCYR